MLAVAAGVAASAGALAITTMMLPLLLLAATGGMFMFGTFATVGAALILPKLILSVMTSVSVKTYCTCHYV